MGKINITIADEATSSDAVKVPSAPSALCGLDIPTIDAANLSFTVSYDGGTTYRALYDQSGNVLTIIGSTGDRYVALEPVKFFGITHLKLVASAAQNGGPRTFGLVFI